MLTLFSITENFNFISLFDQEAVFTGRNACRISLVEGSTKCLGGPFIGGRDRIFLLGEALKFRVFFPKICNKINLKNMKHYWENFRKMQNLHGKISCFCAPYGGKIRITYIWCYKGGSGAKHAKREKFNNFIKNTQ